MIILIGAIVNQCDALFNHYGAVFNNCNALFIHCGATINQKTTSYGRFLVTKPQLGNEYAIEAQTY